MGLPARGLYRLGVDQRNTWVVAAPSAEKPGGTRRTRSAHLATVCLASFEHRDDSESASAMWN